MEHIDVNYLSEEPLFDSYLIGEAIDIRSRLIIRDSWHDFDEESSTRMKNVIEQSQAKDAFVKIIEGRDENFESTCYLLQARDVHAVARRKSLIFSGLINRSRIRIPKRLWGVDCQQAEHWRSLFLLCIPLTLAKHKKSLWLPKELLRLLNNYI